MSTSLPPPGAPLAPGAHLGAPPRPTVRRAPRRWNRPLAGFASLIATLLIFDLLLAPALVRWVAADIPASWVRNASALLLERTPDLQTPGETPEAFTQLVNRFSELSTPGAGTPYRLLYRHSTNPEIRIFSLPSGDIVLTDRFFSAVPDPTRQLALLCVELGHIQQRHALPAAIKPRLGGILLAALSRKRSRGIEALAEGLETVRYSRAERLAADRLAQDMLRINGLSSALLPAAIQNLPDDTAPGRVLADKPTLQGGKDLTTERLAALESGA